MAALVLSIGVLLPARPAMAHGGGDATSNYRTRITSVQPSQPDLAVRVFGAGSTIQLTYTGPGTLVVVGYEGEPYLRISSNGVERNRNSPATYLNQDRYASVDVPTIADADAPPQWEHLSAGRTIEFHDHRTHWMDTVPPATVRADPDRETVIFDHWQIPLTIDGEPATINGDLVWVPAPSRVPWVLLGGALVALAAIGLTRRSWQRFALGIAAVGTTVFCIDTIGYWRAATRDGRTTRMADRLAVARGRRNRRGGRRAAPTIDDTDRVRVAGRADRGGHRRMGPDRRGDPQPGPVGTCRRPHPRRGHRLSGAGRRTADPLPGRSRAACARLLGPVDRQAVQNRSPSGTAAHRIDDRIIRPSSQES